MAETYTVTDFRTHVADVIRRVTLGESVVITSQGRPAARLVPPTRGGSAWIDAGTQPRDHLPQRVQAFHAADNRGSTHLWVHAPTGAMIALTPSGNWDTAGRPIVRYFDPHGGDPAPLGPWSGLGSWYGDDSGAYHAALAAAEAIVAERLADLS